MLIGAKPGSFTVCAKDDAEHPYDLVFVPVDAGLRETDPVAAVQVHLTGDRYNVGPGTPTFIDLDGLVAHYR